MNLELEILNATADDWESLDQIYLSVCFEFDSDAYSSEDPKSSRWQRRYSHFMLFQFVETIQRLIENQEMQAQWDDQIPRIACRAEDILTGWFRMSRKGRERVLREWIE